MGRAGIRTSVRKIHWFRRPGRYRPRYWGANVNPILNQNVLCYVSWCIYLLIRPTHSKWFHKIYRKKKDCMEQNNFCCLLLFIVTRLSQSFCCGCWKEPSQWDGLDIFCTYLSIYLSIYLFTFMYSCSHFFYSYASCSYALKYFCNVEKLAIYMLLSGRWRHIIWRYLSHPLAYNVKMYKYQYAKFD